MLYEVITNPDFLQDYLGLRSEFVDMSEIKGRMDDGIYDNDEFKKAIAWVKDKCIEGPRNNFI